MTLDEQDYASWDDLSRTIAAEAEPPPDETEPPVEHHPPSWLGLMVPGGQWVLDAADDPEPVWGAGSDVLWAEGEALILAGGQGLGKSTIGQQLALGRAGLPEYDTLLDFPIKPGAGRVLYLAMDRPRQIARSLRRMVGTSHRDDLDARLVVWQGPPPMDLARYPGTLAKMAGHVGADTVIVDSLKDAAIGLVDDEVGSGWNRARQTALHDGVQVLELHHNRKKPQGKQSSSGAYSLDDVYGSTWLTSGAGSVVLLSGEPGDLVVGLNHLKQPAEVVGPLSVIHDRADGRTEVREGVDLVLLAGAAVIGLAPRQAAEVMNDTDKPTAAQLQRARRELDKLVAAGRLKVVAEGDQAAGESRRYGRP